MAATLRAASCAKGRWPTCGLTAAAPPRWSGYPSRASPQGRACRCLGTTRVRSPLRTSRWGDGQQHDPLWAGTLGGWWSPLPSGRGTAVSDFTPHVGRDTFDAALARWRADPAGWTEQVVVDCYHEMDSSNRIAESLVALLPD